MEGLIGTDDLEVGRQPSKEDKNINEAREYVRGLLRLMVDKIGVDIPESEWPQVFLRLVGDKNFPEVSAYSPKENIIYIYEPHLNSGITYGEEIGHFIRYYICHKKNDVDFDDQSKQIVTDEFFGRLSENLAREVSQGTDLSLLFQEGERSFLHNKELESKIKEDVETITPVVEKAITVTEENFESKLEAVNRIKSFYSVVEEGESFCREAKIKKVSPSEFLRDLLSIIETGDNGRTSLGNFFLSLEKNGEYPSYTMSLAKILRTSNQKFKELIRDIQNSEVVKSPDFYDLIALHLESVRQSCDFGLFNLSSPNIEVLSVISQTESNLYHIIGYAAAEYYFSQDSTWLATLPEIFQLTNEEVFANLIEREEFKAWVENNESISSLIKLIEKLEELYEKNEIPPDDLD